MTIYFINESSVRNLEAFDAILFPNYLKVSDCIEKRKYQYLPSSATKNLLTQL